MALLLVVAEDCCRSPSLLFPFPLLFDAIEFRDVVELLCNGAFGIPVADPEADEGGEGDCDD